MLHETVTSVVGLLLKIYLYKHDEDLIKHSNSKKKESFEMNSVKCLGPLSTSPRKDVFINN